MKNRAALLGAVFWAGGAWAQESVVVKVTNALRQADAASRASLTESVGEDSRVLARSKLREALLVLEVQNSKRAAEFAGAASKNLPARAMERLEASRAAYAASYERLAVILRQLVAESPSEAVEAARSGLLADVIQILDRLESSARQKPISQSLPVNSPQQQAPPIGVPSGSITTVPIGSIPAILQIASDTFPGVAEVYESVRNGTQAEFYYGVMKGAGETYREGSGNDADTAAVLVQMIRAKGIPALYGRGVVQLRASPFGAMTGAGET